MSCTFAFTKSPIDVVFDNYTSFTNCTITIGGSSTSGSVAVDRQNRRINISFGPISGFASTTYDITVRCGGVTLAEFSISLSGVSVTDQLIFNISFTYTW